MRKEINNLQLQVSGIHIQISILQEQIKEIEKILDNVLDNLKLEVQYFKDKKIKLVKKERI